MTRYTFSLIGCWICGTALADSPRDIAGATTQDQCLGRCAALRDDFIERCVEAGGELRECEIGGRRVFEECLEHCVPDLNCREQCENRAKRVYRVCTRNGGGQDACAQQARKFLQHCIETRCVFTCEERCHIRGREHYNTCIEEGGTEEDCRARAAEFVAACVAGCPVGCEERCAALGEHAFRRCIIEEGGTEEECAELRRRVVAECIQAACPQRCGGIAGEPCLEGQFCQFLPGECQVADNIGVCRAIPEVCLPYFLPVCGCNGVTYGNVCMAAMAGVSIDHRGACAQSCGGVDDEPCPETDYCFHRGGGCPTPESPGLCRARPPLGLDCPGPVCGCDGTTYRTECEAAAAGTAFEFFGLCNADECNQHDPEGCPEGSFCRFAPGECDVDNNIGVCVDIPDDCSADTSIVCGCDGETYSQCGAARAGVSIDHPGYCEDQYCGGDRNHGPCRLGAYCRFQDGECGHSDGPGICHVIPSGCPDVHDPVCGCDGQTYGNACEAAASGVSIDHRGECAD